jgi:hypothetical protein
MSLADDSMKQLKMKKMVLLEIIREVEEEAEEKGLAVEEFDPRIDEPKRQLRLIEDEIREREGKPEDLVVGLNTLKLDMKTKKS